jgi:hypothetical protein
MLTSETLWKYRNPAVAGKLLLVGCLMAVTSIVVAQEAPAKVATAQRELCCRQRNPGMANPIRTIRPANHNLQLSR